ncbi:hypothetical protein CBL_05713 [Carabus blaptoides fortunei]
MTENLKSKSLSATANVWARTLAVDGRLVRTCNGRTPSPRREHNRSLKMWVIYNPVDTLLNTVSNNVGTYYTDTRLPPRAKSNKSFKRAVACVGRRMGRDKRMNVGQSAHQLQQLHVVEPQPLTVAVHCSENKRRMKYKFIECFLPRRLAAQCGAFNLLPFEN